MRIHHFANRNKNYLLVAYTFFMGIVFFEPAFAEWLVLFTSPLLLLYAGKERRFVLLALGLGMLPRLLSVGNALVTGSDPYWRFNLIGVYLLVMFIWVMFLVETTDDWKRLFGFIMAAWIAIAVINTSIGLLAISRGDSNLFGLPRATFGRVRIAGMFKDPNVFGSFLIVPMSVLFTGITRSENWRRTLLGTGVLLLFGLALVLSFSRASWLGAAVAVVTIMAANLFSRNKPVIVRTTIIAVVGLLTLLVILSIDFGLPIYHRVDGVETRMTTLEFFRARLGLQSYDHDLRFVAWRAGLEVFRSNWLFGISPGLFERFHPLSVHNSFIRFATELGVVGVVSHVALGVILMKRRLTFAKPDIQFLAPLLGMFVAALFIDAFHWRHLIFWMALICAVPGKHVEAAE